MNKKQVLLDFINLSTSIQTIGAELLQTKKYDDVAELFNDILTTLSEGSEEIPSTSKVVSAIVDTRFVHFDIGENQTLSISGDQNYGSEE